MIDNPGFWIRPFAANMSFYNKEYLEAGIWFSEGVLKATREKLHLKEG